MTGARNEQVALWLAVIGHDCRGHVRGDREKRLAIARAELAERVERLEAFVRTVRALGLSDARHSPAVRRVIELAQNLLA